ncbi:hypothetical protein Bca52824_033635 [Brassica carinata]|uniref:Uncharacterized protein n=1 Tax=Brassica carinata TaxID=52824 RepID=A0A8X7SD88_BRACI|nr:hypothetical protein Bca52824_033635 [Brassica carinata]
MIPAQLHPICDPSAYTPKSPPSQAPLFSDVDIHLHISADPITPTQPKYDSSAGPASRRACLFPLSPRPGSLESSPTKSQNSIPGFAVHAAGVNAFSATATSHPPVSTTTVHVDEAQPTDNNGVIELSDCGTPPSELHIFPMHGGNSLLRSYSNAKISQRYSHLSTSSDTMGSLLQINIKVWSFTSHLEVEFLEQFPSSTCCAYEWTKNMYVGVHFL